MTRKRGFFGGTFDPIHLGHLNLVIELAEKHQLDEVFFCPTSQSPFKTKNPPIASKQERRAMVTAAISPLPQFTLIDIELQKTDPSYTIDTIRSLIQTDEQNKIKSRYFLLLGEDALDHFESWREVDELVKLAPPLIGSRDKNSFKNSKKSSLFSKIEKGLTPIPLLEISSTELRKRLSQGLYCGHLLPQKVWDYIQQHKLYRERDDGE